MKINQLYFPEKIGHCRYAFKKQLEKRIKKQLLYTNARFFTERADEISFHDYQNGKKIIADIPIVRISKFKKGSTLYNKSFNFSNHSRDSGETDPRKNIYQFKSQLFQANYNDENVGMRVNNTYYINRIKTKDSFRDNESKGFPTMVNLELQNRQKRRYSQILKRRKSLKKKHIYDVYKQRRPSLDYIMSNFIKVQKKQLNSTKTHKSILNKQKFIKCDKKNREEKKKHNSRIGPWAIYSNNQNDIF